MAIGGSMCLLQRQGDSRSAGYGGECGEGIQDVFHLKPFSFILDVISKRTFRLRSVSTFFYQLPLSHAGTGMMPTCCNRPSTSASRTPELFEGVGDISLLLYNACALWRFVLFLSRRGTLAR